MIDILPVWQKGYFGEGIRMRINDNGLDVNHEEFIGRFDSDASCDNNDYQLRPELSNFSHGTFVASIAAASANNGYCSVGVSPKVTLSACYAFHGGVDFLWYKLDQMDVSQNSFGTTGCTEVSQDNTRRRFRRRRDLQQQSSSSCLFTYKNDFFSNPCEVCDFTVTPLSSACEENIVFHCEAFYEEDANACLDFLELYIQGGECRFNSLTEDQVEGLTAGVSQGRNGKGVIYIFAVGNQHNAGDDVNYAGLVNTRFTISVGAVGKDELHASYSTPGAAIFLTGPGGDSESVTNHVTASAGGGCKDATEGTSFSCPVVSGVVALLLEANPELTWRDVQGILAVTSRAVTKDVNDATRVTNAAGFTHSNLYGFGIVNASYAVTTAETWENWGPEQMLVGDSGILNLTIVDSELSSTISSATIAANENASDFVTESVEILLDLRSFSRGDLEVTLTSPQGTKSVLAPGKRPEDTQLDVDERWNLMTVRAWGESPFGEWTLNVIDLSAGDSSDCVDRLWHVDVGNIRFDCFIMEMVRYCVDGDIDMTEIELRGAESILDVTDEDEGLTSQEACCVCGGGRTRADGDFVSQVVQWQIVVYGRSSGNVTVGPNESTAISTSPIASNISDSAVPTVSPSLLLTDSPSDAPEVAPKATSLSPSTSLTEVLPSPLTKSPTPSPSKSPVIDIGSLLKPTILQASAGAGLYHRHSNAWGATNVLFWSLLLWWL
jgi:subtilisin-like proprotein convertase family protein